MVIHDAVDSSQPPSPPHTVQHLPSRPPRSPSHSSSAAAQCPHPLCHFSYPKSIVWKIKGSVTWHDSCGISPSLLPWKSMRPRSGRGRGQRAARVEWCGRVLGDVGGCDGPFDRGSISRFAVDCLPSLLLLPICSPCGSSWNLPTQQRRPPGFLPDRDFFPACFSCSLMICEALHLAVLPMTCPSPAMFLLSRLLSSRQCLHRLLCLRSLPR
mmetsp:Transcript_19656/g.36834  ORF Transcript_19656/g.36834 Transcript_19656/m.36834 type:complete len:212 (+) Transcript_19656:2273-2908(+)